MFKNFSTLPLLTLILLVSLSLAACQQTPPEMEKEINVDQMIAPVSVTEGTMTAEIADLVSQRGLSKASCTLGSDVGCDEAADDVEYFIRNCTSYPVSPVFTGIVLNYTYTLVYYVDSDSDINLDQYERVLQAHVSDIAAREGVPLFFVAGDVTSWGCSTRTYNVGTISYTVLR